MRVRVVVLLVLIAGGLAWVGTRALSGNLVYFVTPTELKAKERGSADKFMRMGGMVVPGSLQKDVKNLTYRFEITDGVDKMPVVYEKALPTSFKEGGEVIVEGVYQPGADFEAKTLLVKCPSKYKPKATKKSS